MLVISIFPIFVRCPYYLSKYKNTFLLLLSKKNNIKVWVFLIAKLHWIVSLEVDPSACMNNTSASIYFGSRHKSGLYLTLWREKNDYSRELTLTWTVTIHGPTSGLARSDESIMQKDHRPIAEKEKCNALHFHCQGKNTDFRDYYSTKPSWVMTLLKVLQQNIS
jgi:hypothetical protein